MQTVISLCINCHFLSFYFSPFSLSLPPLFLFLPPSLVTRMQILNFFPSSPLGKGIHIHRRDFSDTINKTLMMLNKSKNLPCGLRTPTSRHLNLYKWPFLNIMTIELFDCLHVCLFLLQYLNFFFIIVIVNTNIFFLPLTTS